MSLAEAVKLEARRLGFDLVGITTPEPPPHAGAYKQWIASNRHGEMAYLASDEAIARRVNPVEIMPECRSILVLGMRYSTPVVDEGEQTAGLRGRVAAYAWGDDYHDIFPPRLKALVAWIEARAGRPAPNRWYTDTGPVLERDLAQRAGLGWAGKNTCLIHPQQGSYFLLAEILLGIDLEPDPPFATDHCGACTRCLDACPTACIQPDRTIDARRCISYLTIELKGPIPPELRPQTGDWVFGCDICQQVCPWNVRFSPQAPAIAAELKPRPGVPAPDLVSELSLTPEEFNRKFKGSPVRRAKRRGYLRNVAVALGNAKAPAAFPALTRALLADPEPLVRGHAAWAFGQIGGEEARQALHQSLQVETDPFVLAEIQAALDIL